MQLIGKSLVMRTRAATEGRPYTGSGVGAVLRATAVRLSAKGEVFGVLGAQTFLSAPGSASFPASAGRQTESYRTGRSNMFQIGFLG